MQRKNKIIKKKYNIDYGKKIRKFELKVIAYNFFFDFHDENDDYFYLFYDLVDLDYNKNQDFFKPHNYSFFFRFFETKKWFITRLINNVNKNYDNKKKYKNTKNLIIWNKWQKKILNLKKWKLKDYRYFNYQIKLFKFKQFYFFFLFFDYSIFFRNHYIFLKKLLFFFKNNLNQLFHNKFKILKKNNKKILNLKLNNKFFLIMSFENQKFYWWNKIFLYFFFKINYFFEMYIIEEKQKIENLLFYFKAYVDIINELYFIQNIILKKKLRKKVNEEVIKTLREETLITVWLDQKKRRSNNQIIFNMLKIKSLKQYLLLNLNFLEKKDIFKKNIKQNNYFLFYFKKYFFYFIFTWFLDLDKIYVFYLPKRKWGYKKKRFSLFYQSIYNANMEKQNFNFKKKNNIQSYNNITGLEKVKFINKKFNVKFFNNVNIKFLYKNLGYKKGKGGYLKKKFNFYKNIIPFLRFLKRAFLIKENISYLFNIYFWLVIFLKLLKKSIFFFIKNILNLTSFLKVIKIIFKNNFNWFKLKTFKINLVILTWNEIIIKFSCNIQLLLQEVCLYFFYNVYKFLTWQKTKKFYENSFYFKLKKLKLLKNINYVFKGCISFEINSNYCLNLIEKFIGKSFYYIILQNFLFNCQISSLFIKQNIKLYWSLLEFVYLTLDKLINNILTKFNLKKKIFYLRYKNTILVCSNLIEKTLIKFLIKNFICFFLYFCLKLYLFSCNIYNLNKQVFEFMFFIFYKKHKKLKIKISKFILLNLLITYNIIKKKNNKIIIKPAQYLLNFNCVYILNYFFNIWNDLNFYFIFLKNKFLKFLYNILYKACFLTLKFKLPHNVLKWNLFKKIFKLNLILKKKDLNKNLINNYMLNINKLNLKTFLNKVIT